MDGTLLNSKGEIPCENSRAVRYFMENGGMFAVATGRAKKSVERFLPGLETNVPSIVHNGSLISDLSTGRIVRQIDLSQKAKELVEHVLKLFPDVGIEICMADEQYVARNNDYTERHHRNVGLELVERAYRNVKTPWLKLNLTQDHEKLLKVRDFISEKYGDCFFGQFSLPHYYEIMAREASKGHSALWLAKYLNIDMDNFYTVGDGTNDLELIRVSGKNSYAPSNATEIILENARHLLPDNDSGAIAGLIALLDGKY